MPKSSQTEIPMTGEGVERKVIKPLEDAIEAWNSIKEKRMALTEKEIAAKAVVTALMERHEVKLYQYDDDHEVVLLDTVKSRKIKQAGDEDDDG